MLLSPHCETNWSKSGGVSCGGHLQILILSAVKICIQCVQTASASVRRLPLPLDHTGDASSPDGLGYSPQIKIPRTTTVDIP